MKDTLIKKWKELEIYHGVIYFMILLTVCHFFWKFSVKEVSPYEINFFQWDVSQPFFKMTTHIRNVTSHVLYDWLNFDLHVHKNSIHYSNGNVVHIVWSCSGIKQMYIFFCLIFFYKNNWLHKLWYIPLGLFLVYVLNLLRIITLTWLAKDHMPYVDIFHNYILKYLFYAIIFFLWLFWEEKFNKRTKIK